MRPLLSSGGRMIPPVTVLTVAASEASARR